MTESVQAPREAATLAQRDRAHVIHPHRPLDMADQVIIERGSGCTVWDVDGREYLDANSGLALSNIGHGRAEIAAAVTEQMDRLEYFPSFWEYGNPISIELATRLVGLAPDGLEKVFFTSGGSEGIETALRMARFYHHERGQPERSIVLARHCAYHGVGYGSGSLTGFDDFHVGFAPNLPDVHHLTPPWSFRRDLFEGADPTDFCVTELRATIERLGPERVAAFVGEPVMGVAGMVVPPDDYWPRIQEVLREHDILVVADEVITGYGRTGRWFGSLRYGIKPDIMVTAKGITSGYLPLGAVLVSREVASYMDRGGDGFPIGFSYTAHPVTCAAAMANLDLLERDHLIERVDQLGGRILERLAGLESLPIVGEVRGVGLMFAIELVSQMPGRTPLELNFRLPDVLRHEYGVILRCEGNVVSFAPPFIISETDADRIVDVLADALGRVDANGGLRELAR
jgi:adenosylmethionine-8-amino-7-oxononanoate aminotransferase